MINPSVRQLGTSDVLLRKNKKQGRSRTIYSVDPSQCAGRRHQPGACAECSALQPWVLALCSAQKGTGDGSSWTELQNKAHHPLTAGSCPAAAPRAHPREAGSAWRWASLCSASMACLAASPRHSPGPGSASFSLLPQPTWQTGHRLRECSLGLPWTLETGHWKLQVGLRHCWFWLWRLLDHPIFSLQWLTKRGKIRGWGMESGMVVPHCGSLCGRLWFFRGG